MKHRFIAVLACLFLTASFNVSAEEAAPAPVAKVKDPSSRTGSMNAGAMGFGYYEYSLKEALYVDFDTDHVSATGLGFRGFLEYGLNEHIAVGGDVSFSYILDSNLNLGLNNLARSFWNLDLLGAYYFTKYDQLVQPYVAFGGGVLFSDNGITPVLDLGFGSHFKLNETVSIKAEIMGKSGIVHNRVEAGLGLAFHF